jgi:hypothetical protein
MDLIATLSLNNSQHNDTWHKNFMSLCRIFLTAMLNVVMLSVTMLIVIMLSVVMLSVLAPIEVPSFLYHLLHVPGCAQEAQW